MYILCKWRERDSQSNLLVTYMDIYVFFEYIFFVCVYLVHLTQISGSCKRIYGLKNYE